MLGALAAGEGDLNRVAGVGAQRGVDRALDPRTAPNEHHTPLGQAGFEREVQGGSLSRARGRVIHGHGGGCGCRRGLRGSRECGDRRGRRSAGIGCGARGQHASHDQQGDNYRDLASVRHRLSPRARVIGPLCGREGRFECGSLIAGCASTRGHPIALIPTRPRRAYHPYAVMRKACCALYRIGGVPMSIDRRPITSCPLRAWRAPVGPSEEESPRSNHPRCRSRNPRRSAPSDRSSQPGSTPRAAGRRGGWAFH